MTAKPRLFHPSLFLAALFLIGCADDTESLDEKIPLAPAGDSTESSDDKNDETPESSDGSKWTKIVGMSFDISDDWKKVELQGMQASILAAKYVLANYSPDLELTVSRVGGGMDSNLKRWQGQFVGGSVRRSSESIDGHDVQIMELDGEFNSGMVQQKRLDWGMIGVGIEDDDQNVYLKLTGPREDIENAREEFLSFVKRIRP